MSRMQGRWKLSSLLGSLARTSGREEIEPEDTLSAVDEVARLVLAFNQSPEDSGGARLQALMTADQGCQALLEEFRVECLQRPTGATDREEGWGALDSVHRQFARGYEKFLMAHKDLGQESAASAQLATISARLLFHITMLAKLSFFRSHQMEPRLWQLAHHVYEYAETEGVDERVIALYNTPDRIETTCQCVFARLLMLDTLVGAGLNPRQLELVDQWLREWLSGVLIFREFTEGRYRYQVDLEVATGASRLMPEPFPASMRFIDTETACIRIEHLRRSLRSGEVSGLLGLSAGFKGVEFVELLDRLERLWSLSWVGRDQRIHVRERVENQSLDIVRGLAELCRSARRDFSERHEGGDKGVMSPAEEMDLKIYGFVTERTRARLAQSPEGELGFERWTIFDRSENGYGTVIPAEDEGALRSGSLLGLREPGQRRWSVGVVARRLALGVSTEVFVGIELLARTPVIVSIEPAARELAVAGPLHIPAGRENHWALFLPGVREKGRPDTLLIDTSMYSTAKPFHLAARNASYTIRMNRIVAKGEGWRRVGFEVVAKRS